jgi:hypothetical protein
MKKLILILLLALNNIAFTQEDKNITLIVSGQGKTLEEAKQNALRSAIEQAFGTFISSKTEILNDNLVKDEIVSVANGNIQKFEIISEVQIPNGDYATSLKATVSVTKLTSFVESKGVVADFKGSILAANVKQQMLNEQNEIKSLGNIVNTCKEILDLSCDFEIIRGEPSQINNDNNQWAVPIEINVKFNKNIEQFTKYFLQTIKKLSMSESEILKYKELGKNTHKIALGISSTSGFINQIDELKYLSKSNPNLTYKIIAYGKEIFSSDNLSEITNEFNKKKAGGQDFLYSIMYFDTTVNPIYHFRTLSAVISIIDLINYTKHSALNFQITNGLDTITYEKALNRNNDFKILTEDLTPIFNSAVDGGYYIGPNGPSGIFGVYPGEVSIYEPTSHYNRIFYYNGFRDERFFDKVYNSKYKFLIQADNDLPRNIFRNQRDLSNDGYLAVISLFDFNYNAVNFVNFYYRDILSLEEIEKVQEYKIIPILKN